MVPSAGHSKRARRSRTWCWVQGTASVHEAHVDGAECRAQQACMKLTYMVLSAGHSKRVRSSRTWCWVQGTASVYEAHIHVLSAGHSKRVWHSRTWCWVQGTASVYEAHIHGAECRLVQNRLFNKPTSMNMFSALSFENKHGTNCLTFDLYGPL